MSEQNKIDGNSPDTMGIKCYVRCTSNKIDTAKDDVRSLNFNFDIRVGDKLVGKGNNLNINNIYPDDYVALCNAFGVDDIREDTPFYAELMTLLTKERKIEWSTAMERKDKKIDKDQADVTQDPDAITPRQLALISDWRAKDPRLDKMAKLHCDILSLKDESMLNKAQALELITKMKEEVEGKQEPTKDEVPKKKVVKKK